MSKTNDLSLTLDQLITTGERIVAAAKEITSCGDILIKTAKDIKAVFSSYDEPIVTKQIEAKPIINPKVEMVYTKEDVRAVLADKASAGYRAEVKELLTKYGASQLMQVDPANYAALLEDAQVIGNG